MLESKDHYQNPDNPHFTAGVWKAAAETVRCPTKQSAMDAVAEVAFGEENSRALFPTAAHASANIASTRRTKAGSR
jgi:hypothetical protein